MREVEALRFFGLEVLLPALDVRALVDLARRLPLLLLDVLLFFARFGAALREAPELFERDRALFDAALPPLFALDFERVDFASPVSARCLFTMREATSSSRPR